MGAAGCLAAEVGGGGGEGGARLLGNGRREGHTRHRKQNAELWQRRANDDLAITCGLALPPPLSSPYDTWLNAPCTPAPKPLKSVIRHGYPVVSAAHGDSRTTRDANGQQEAR